MFSSLPGKRGSVIIYGLADITWNFKLKDLGNDQTTGGNKLVHQAVPLRANKSRLVCLEMQFETGLGTWSIFTKAMLLVERSTKKKEVWPGIKFKI